MPSFKTIFSTAALVALAQAHAVFLAAQGEAGSPNSVGFQVASDIARNCTGINPCQQDTTIIRDLEIKNNVVNECGRTELTGNIDIGENTENALAAKQVTQVKAGTRMQVTVHQVNADGAGPYSCDLIEAGNNGVISQNLTVENNVPGVNGFSQARTQQFNITVVMPQNFNCAGSSAGNVCTVRCRNNALAGPFGGCFPVQQAGAKAASNTPQSVTTNLDAQQVAKQVSDDQKDFPAAVAANQVDGSAAGVANLKKVVDLLNAKTSTLVSLAAPVQTLDVALGGNGAASSAPAAAPATPTKAPAAGNGANRGNGNANKNKNKQNNGNNNAAKARGGVSQRRRDMEAEMADRGFAY